MINETAPFDGTREAVIERLKAYFGPYDLKDVDLDDVATVLVRFMSLDEEHDRKMFIRGISALVCGKCGKPSCLCGYSDD